MADQERWYIIDGEEFPSVTTVLGAVVAKQGFLIDWALKQQWEEIKGWQDRNATTELPVDSVRQELTERRESEGFRPARIGDAVHDIISQSIRNPDILPRAVSVLTHCSNPDMTQFPDSRLGSLGQMFDELSDLFERHELPINEVAEPVLNCLQGWVDWCSDFGISVNPEFGTSGRFEIVESEALVWHTQSDTRYAGTTDLVLVDNENPYDHMIVDIKTGQLYAEAMYQVSAYAAAYQEGILRGLDGSQPALTPAKKVSRCFLLQLKKERPKTKTTKMYAVKEARNWTDMYWNGFVPAFKWWSTFKQNTLGSQLTPEQFRG